MLTSKTAHLIFFLINIQASKEAGKLKEAKDNLEKEVKELTRRLQLEKQMRVCASKTCYFVLPSRCLSHMVHKIA